MKNYKTIVHDNDGFWQVDLVSNITNKPFVWMKLSKWEFPTKEEAVEYLEESYESEKDIPTRDIFEKVRMKQMPYRMMEPTERKKKKKTVKPKMKKKCRCK